VGKVYKVEKVRSTFHTFHDYLNFCGEKKDDRLFTIYQASVNAFQLYDKPYVLPSRPWLDYTDPIP